VAETTEKKLIPPRLDMSGITESDKTAIFSAFKHKGIYSTQDAEVIFTRLTQIVDDFKEQNPARYGSLTLAHVLRIVDELRDKEKGVANATHTLEKKVVAWWTQ